MRLIDADALIEVLQNEPKYSIELPANMGDAIKKLLNVHQKMVIEVVKKQPTAYDPEAVVKELENKFEQTVAEILDKTGRDFTIADFNIKRYSNRICEIVRKGGAE